MQEVSEKRVIIKCLSEPTSIAELLDMCEDYIVKFTIPIGEGFKNEGEILTKHSEFNSLFNKNCKLIINEDKKILEHSNILAIIKCECTKD